ncbi:type I polyketide synthase [Streptomyces sp. A1277]|uniref:type I polyketide synthase n=1 Tax=Streptomyces sp. A1277 TaxID=2563103 RepID=UPI0014474243|nr:type I polyketide synthase [Streptomyces sp. A1277]
MKSSRAGDQPVAIVGVSCRLPGAADPDAFWRLLTEGRSAVGRVPAGREPAGGEPAGGDRGGFIEGADRFDAGFFGITPREAGVLDPQQRLMLELAWEAFEDARIVAGELSGSATGVFVGAMRDDYALLAAEAGRAALNHHAMAGLSRGVIANRVSHTLGLRGPSLVIDTGQASSLVAVHTAMESLRRGESTLALAGGVNLNLAPGTGALAEEFGGLSPDGRCYTFDHRANGFVRGEGGVALVLRLLPDAIAAGDRVYGVLHGGAVNHDGAAEQLTTPSRHAQAEVLRQAYASAGVAPESVQYVELHGTGTPVGDPVEAAALGAVLGSARDAAHPLLVGSVKTNLGHLEAAAGAAGLLKTVLALSHGHIPASLDFEEPNPAIPLAELNLRVVGDPTEWPDTDRPRIAGVSSFGMGGTNCHLVLSQAPAPAPAAPATPPARMPLVPWVLSGRSAAALRGQAAALRPAVGAADPCEVGWSLVTTRTRFEHRAVVVGGDTDDLDAGLEALAQGEWLPQTVSGVAGDGLTGFVFSGQGGQRVGMGRELAEAFPVFAAALDEVCGHFDGLREVMFTDAEALKSTGWAQPALFAVEVALFRLVESWGVRPDYLVGHSVGELAAAHVAGVFSLADACRLVAARAGLMQALPAGGAMWALRATPDEVTPLLVDGASVAAVNAPGQVVVSGAREAVEAVAAQLTDHQGRRLDVSHAFHSSLMDPMLSEFASAASELTYGTPRIPIVSTLTAEPVTEFTASYWADQVRGTVRFADALTRLASLGVTRFMELGPDAGLVGAIGETREGALAVAALSRKQAEPVTAVTALARLWTDGVDVDWTALFPGPAPATVDLPTYAFQRRRHWFDTAAEPATGEEVVTSAAAARLAAARTQDERLLVLLDLVRTRAAAVLGYEEAEAVPARTPFKDIGFDSQSLLRLSGRVATDLAVDLPGTVLFDHPTPERLAAYLLEAVHGRPVAPAAPEPVRTAADEPLAIVGMACRLPGEVDGPDALWKLLVAGGDAIGPLPADRGWDVDALYDPDPDRPGTSYVRAGGFLGTAAEFDHEFFGISAREALAMDPQQRLLMQTAWAAFENAGLLPDDLKGSDTGVFAGVMPSDYVSSDSLPDELVGYQVTGGAPSVASGRLAYHFGFTGPAVSIDTACSGSLVALHMAAQSLASGECGLALVAGVSVTPTPASLISFSRLRALSADGRCRAFAEGADGFGMAEGVGVLLVERLSDARRNGHRVLALVRGSAINQDGASNGLTAPNGLSQQRVIRQALGRAGLDAADVDAVEAHGTGTRLGDPIEAQALIATYGEGRPAERPLWLGSVKSNVGHTQAAAGVVGVIKMVQALRHGTLPGTLHVAEPTSRVDWEAGGVRLLAESRPWPDTDRPRRAAVSAFGISGTNAHVILEQAPELRPVPVAEPAAGGSPVVPWLLSARDAQVLRDQAAALGAWPDGGAEPAAVGRELATARTWFEHRAVVVGGHEEGLRALAAGEPCAYVVSGLAGPLGRTVFVFPGQGAQWAGMGAGLLEGSEVFARAVAECEEALSAYVDWSLTDVLRGAEGAASLERVDVVQPASFAVMVALAAVWRSYGIEPAAVVGHSQGEIAAACVAGALSLEDAARVVCLRSKALTALAGRGAMAIVAVPEEEADALVSRFDGRLSVAAVNGPGMVVLSGDPAALDDVSRDCQERGVRVRMIPVDYASHSAHVEEILDELGALLAPVRPRTPQVPFFSTVTADWIDSPALDAAYWGTNLRRPVRFAEAVRALAGQGHGLFVECSPHPVLLAATEETLAEHGDACAVGSLRRNDGGPDRMLLSLAEAWVRGAPVDFGPAFTGGSARPAADLPTYPFRRRRHWLEAPARAAARQETAVIDSWRYRVDWTPVPDTGEPALTGDWLVVTPQSPARDGLVKTVLTGLARHGATPHAVGVDDLAREDVALPDRIDGILSLAALDERPCDDEPGATAGLAGLAGTVAAVRALAGRAPGAPLWLATSGAVGTAPDDTVRAPLQAQVWGLGVVLGLEEADRACGLVDLPHDLGEDSLPHLATVLSGTTGEHEVAVRDDAVYARRLVHAPAPDAEPWRPRGTVLITGGTGVLGAHVARWAARNGAARLILTSRLGPDAPGTEELTAELTALGAQVTVAACDAADADRLAALLATIDAERPLTAVVHAAGTTHPETPVGDLSTAELARVLRAKVAGARNLDALTADLDLDAFVLFSSGAGIWGDVGKAGYAAANAYLDAFAAERRARGAVATSVAWGAWDGGMSEGDAADLFARRGVRLMTPERAVRALARAVGQGDTTVAVADFDLARFLPLYTMTRDRRLVAELSPVQQAAAQPVPRSYTDGAEPAPEPSSALADRLAGLPAQERESALTDLVTGEAAVVLKADGPQSVRPRSTFKELGFDSLTALEFRNRLGTATGLRLPASLIYDHPTPVALVQHLSDELFGGADDVLAELDRVEARLSALPDEERDRLGLADRLRALLRRVEPAEYTTAGEQADDDLTAASNDEIFDLIDRELGIR